MPALPLALALLIAAPPAPATPSGPGMSSSDVGFVPVVRAGTPPVLAGTAGAGWASAVSRRLERSKGPLPLSSDLQYHEIRSDAAGMILPWSDDDPAHAYDRVM